MLCYVFTNLDLFNIFCASTLHKEQSHLHKPLGDFALGAILAHEWNHSLHVVLHTLVIFTILHVRQAVPIALA